MKYALFILCCCCLQVNANTITVGKQKQYRSITAAVAAAQNGDTILVDKGVYHEKNLIINKQLFLKGINYPVLDGEKKYEIISINADNVTVDGFLLQHSGVSSIIDFAAIKIYNRHNVSVINNIINDAFFGIYSQYGINCLIQNNILTATAIEEQQSGNGIHCWKSDSMRIIANTISGHRDGIYFEFVTNSVIWRNNSFKNMRYGLHFMFSNDDAYISNTFDVGTNGSLVMNRFINNYWDKYEGYDLNRDNIGDVPYRPVSMYSMIVEQNPPAMILFHSFIVSLMDKSEKVIPSLTPENLKDEHPLMKSLPL